MTASALLRQGGIRKKAVGKKAAAGKKGALPLELDL